MIGEDYYDIANCITAVNPQWKVGAITKERCGLHGYLSDENRNDNASKCCSLLWQFTHELRACNEVVVVSEPTSLRTTGCDIVDIELAIVKYNGVKFPNLREALIYIRLNKLLD